MVSSARQGVRVVTDPVRVMVVDDSVVARGLISRWIDEDPELAVVATHRTGAKAVDDIGRSDPDVVVLDIEMPDMDGLTALPLLLRKKPNLRVLMASTLTSRNAEISLRALSLGASDYVAKPESSHGVTTSAHFRRELIEKVRGLGLTALKKKSRRNVVAEFSSQGAVAKEKVALREVQPLNKAKPNTYMHAKRDDFHLKPYSSVIPRALFIGSSTGGPQALTVVLGYIGKKITQIPIFVTQHMPPAFTPILATHMQKASGLPAAEGLHGENVLPGRIYIAPGGKHMSVEKGADGPMIQLNDGPQVHFCKPAVDPLFHSAARIYGSAVLAVVLTGMGVDGADGAIAIADAGGSVIAQDEVSSVVWGMPQAAAATGKCSSILTIEKIGPTVERLICGERP